ncbi:MAG: hypothetical protein K9H11_13410 [Rhodospirillum sp.]|nr:hypothetical protein [Rhodospirillum sp.]
MTDPYVWQGPCLLTPLTVEALLVGNPNRTSDWADLQISYQNVPLGGDPSPKPFQLLPAPDVPGTGAHLLAILPNGLRQAQTSGDQATYIPIPNRWLVTRTAVVTDGQPPSVRAWVLQGDYLGTEGTNPWPGPTLADPTTFIGKAFEIDTWVETGGPATPVLRAAAPGSISWMVCYDNVRNIMAFHDPLTDVASGSVSYGMVGWYQPPSFDPLLGVTDGDPHGFTDQDSWTAIMNSLSFTIPGGDTGLQDAQAAWADWLAAHPDIDDSALPEAQRALAAQIVGHGFVFGLPWTGANTSYPRAPILSDTKPLAVAVGANGMEAIAAWMANVLDNPNAEDLLLALGEDLVFTYGSDPAAFAQQTLAGRFSKTIGGAAWHVTLVHGQTPSGTDILQTVPLTDEQTAALEVLNSAQEAIDTASRTYDTVLWELFSLVWKETVDGISYDYPTLITERVETLQGLEATKAAQTTARNQALASLRDLLDAEVHEVSSAPTTRFQEGMAPTVLIAGAAGASSYQTQDEVTDLPCRFTGQTLTGLEVVDADAKLPDPTEVTAAQMLAAIPPSSIAPSSGGGIPKEYQDLLGEWMLLDTGNAQWMARLLYANANVTDYSNTDLENLSKTIQTLQTLHTNTSLTSALTADEAGEAAGFVGVMPPALCALPYSPAWVPLFIDWQTPWSPSAATADAMLADWILDESYVYSWTGGAVSAAVQDHAGRVLLNTAVAGQFCRSLEAFVASPEIDQMPPTQASLLRQAALAMPQYDIITQGLGGLNEAFITRAGAITGLTYSGGTPSVNETVNAYLAQSPSLAPLPSPPGFYPLRAGHVTLKRIWVVDAFGQILNPSPTQTVLPIRGQGVTTPPTGSSSNGAYIQLAPRVVAPTRLNLMALDANDDGVPTNSAESTSPICGWLLPNHLDNSLQVFTAKGTDLGEILPVVNDSGAGMRWDPAPGLTIPLGSPPNVENAHVLSFVNALLATQLQTGDQALTELLDAIDTSLWATAPRGQPGDEATAALVGCPLAIVRASVRLDLFGDPPYDQLWADTPTNNDGGLTQVPLTTYLGDLSLGNNGVLGFFLDDDYARFRPARGGTGQNGVQQVAALRRGLRAGRGLSGVMASQAALDGPSSGYIATDPSFTLTPNGDARLVTVIMDPRGWMTAYNGMSPITELGLPPGPVSTGLSNLAATFRIGPILWDPQSPELPLPALSGGAKWSWVARSEVAVWESNADLAARQPRTVVPPRVLTLREGWLSLSDFLDAGGGTDGLAKAVSRRDRARSPRR